MSLLGDALEAMHPAEARSPALHVTARAWVDRARVMEATRALHEREGATVVGASGSGRVPQPDERELRLWLQRPDRCRVERGGGSVGVHDGTTWWGYAPERGAMREDHRSVLAANAMCGEPLQRVAVEQIAFDVALDPGTFVFTPPEGERVLTHDDLRPRMEPVSLDEAARRPETAGFTLVAPTRLPEGAHARVRWMAGRDRPHVEPSVTIAYLLPDRATTIHVAINAETTRKEHRTNDWSEHRRGDRTVWAREIGGQAQAQTEHLGVVTEIVGDALPLDTIVAIAAALEPAPTTPPRLI